jgi:hypothetical protein
VYSLLVVEETKSARHEYLLVEISNPDILPSDIDPPPSSIQTQSTSSHLRLERFAKFEPFKEWEAKPTKWREMLHPIKLLLTSKYDKFSQRVDEMQAARRKMLGVTAAVDTIACINKLGQQKAQAEDWQLYKLHFKDEATRPSYLDLVTACATVSKLCPNYSLIFMCYW